MGWLLELLNYMSPTQLRDTRFSHTVNGFEDCLVKEKRLAYNPNNSPNPPGMDCVYLPVSTQFASVCKSGIPVGRCRSHQCQYAYYAGTLPGSSALPSRKGKTSTAVPHAILRLHRGNSRLQLRFYLTCATLWGTWEPFEFKSSRTMPLLVGRTACGSSFAAVTRQQFADHQRVDVGDFEFVTKHTNITTASVGGLFFFFF